MGDQRGCARPSRVGIKHSQWTREDMQRAIEACKTGMMTPSQAAKEHNVPRKTLTDRLQRKLLKQQLTEGDYMARPQDIYNCDESIVDLNKCTQRVVVPKRMRHAHSREVASSEHISIHCCVSASGHAMPTFIIFKQSFPGGNYSRDGPDGCLYGKQDSGFMDSELFLQWFEQLFIVHSRPSPDRPVLVLLDGHISHCSPQLIESAIRHNVTLFALAPHTTHICKPLDVAVYKTFKSHLGKLVNLGKAIKGNFWVPKKNIPTMLKGPFESNMTMANIKAGFRKCGIIPFNPNAVDKTLLMRNKLIPNTDVDLSEPPAQAFVTTGTQTDDPLQRVPNVPVPHAIPSTQTDDPLQGVPHVTLSTQTDDPLQGVPNIPVTHVTPSKQTDDPPQDVPQVKLSTPINKPSLGVHDVVTWFHLHLTQLS
ncbi:hypothetical protein Pmani_005213 [Petrolisthes manimaculis]|uniref:HTH psq-type domain-containing protein n=1 Tax=Petrolisthes manimaculis TaxID=1843537 RepID=A0AAE1QCQ5_9EUCA|nr:hypothetical protein Pmani_005213 [Petrolisthes manimaculis]